MIYPFRCVKCGTEFSITLEVLKYESQEIKYVCPICRSSKVKRTFYSDGISIQFKGDGFTKSVKEVE